MQPFVSELGAVIAEKHLLTHPFYRAWSAGTLPISVMQEYAKQYYHLEKNFPIFLSTIHSNAGEDFVSRQAITNNLHDEERGKQNHRELWLRYAEAIGVDRSEVESSEPILETKAAIDTFVRLAKSSMIEGVAGLTAYESQIPSVAESKLDGLKKHYGITSKSDTAFFRLHQTLDVAHANAWWHIIDRYATTNDIKQTIHTAVVEGRDALWGFLDGIVRTYLPDLGASCAMDPAP